MMEELLMEYGKSLSFSGIGVWVYVNIALAILGIVAIVLSVKVESKLLDISTVVFAFLLGISMIVSLVAHVSNGEALEKWEEEESFIIHYGEVEKYIGNEIRVEEKQEDNYGDLKSVYEVDREVSGCEQEVFAVTNKGEVWVCTDKE